MDTEEGADTGISAGQFHHDEPTSQCTHAWAAIALDAAASNIERGKLGNKLKGELSPLPVVIDDGNNLFVREGTHFIANAAFFLGQKFIHQVKIGPERLPERLFEVSYHACFLSFRGQRIDAPRLPGRKTRAQLFRSMPSS